MGNSQPPANRNLDCEMRFENAKTRSLAKRANGTSARRLAVSKNIGRGRAAGIASRASRWLTKASPLHHAIGQALSHHETRCDVLGLGSVTNGPLLPRLSHSQAQTTVEKASVPPPAISIIANLRFVLPPTAI